VSSRAAACDASADPAAALQSFLEAWLATHYISGPPLF
jgi:hypothetical protein